jgi:hypothetical protein
MLHVVHQCRPCQNSCARIPAEGIHKGRACKDRAGCYQVLGVALRVQVIMRVRTQASARCMPSSQRPERIFRQGTADHRWHAWSCQACRRRNDAQARPPSSDGHAVLTFVKQFVWREAGVTTSSTFQNLISFSQGSPCRCQKVLPAPASCDGC